MKEIQELKIEKGTKDFCCKVANLAKEYNIVRIKLTASTSDGNIEANWARGRHGADCDNISISASVFQNIKVEL